MSNVGQRHVERRMPGAGRLKAQRIAPSNPQLFEDTSMQSSSSSSSYGYPPPDTGHSNMYGQPPMGGQYNQGGSYPSYNMSSAAGGSGSDGFPGQQVFNDPMANMAMQYGQVLAGQGSEYVSKNIEKYTGVATNKLKYYFNVDTGYVGKKLALLVFPFAHRNWAISYREDEPSAPRYDVNAPDLYIPVMSFVTYILLAGISLGTQNRFTPEQLGIMASTALVWMIIELVLLNLSIYILSVSTGLKYLDLLAYCGYKYVGMIVVILSGLLFDTTGYYIALGWTGFSIAFFLVRSLKLALVPHSSGSAERSFESGNKRRLYLLLFVAVTQPSLIWWLTRYVA